MAFIIIFKRNKPTILLYSMIFLEQLIVLQPLPLPIKPKFTSR